MKKISLILGLLCAITAPAQYITQPSVLIRTGTNANDHTGELIGRGTWQEINFSLTNKDAQIAQLQATNAALQNQLAAITNCVQTSQTFPLLTSNFFVFNNSNYLGNFTNVWSITDSTQAGGTNYALTNVMNVGGGWVTFYQTNPLLAVVVTNLATNQIVTNYLVSTPFVQTNIVGGTNVVVTNYFNLSYLGTNFATATNIYTNYLPVGVQLAVLSPSFNTTGSVSVASITPWNLAGQLIKFAGQAVDLSSATIVNTTNVAFLVPGGTNHLNLPVGWVTP